MKKIYYGLLLCLGMAHAADTRQQIPDVTLRHTDVKSSFSGGNKHIISRQTMVNAGASSLTEVLQSSGMIQLHDASSSGSQPLVSLRGFGANAGSNTLFLINGIPVTHPDLAPPDLNTIPLEMISQIEITSGSESVLYGDQAVGGVINIVTDHATEKNIRLQCNAGSYNTRECHASVINFYRDLNYQAALTSKTTDNYREHNHYLNDTLHGSALYKTERHQLAVDYQFTHENMQYPGALTATQVRQNRTQASNDTDYFKDNNQSLHLKIKSRLREDWTLNNDVLLNNMNGSGVLSAPFTQARHSIYLKPTLSAKIENYRMKSGMDMHLDQYHLGSAYGLTNNHQVLGGLFVLIKAAITSRLTLAAGARGAEQATQLTTSISANTINRALTTTLSGTYQVARHLSFYLRRAGNFRFPKAEENTAGKQPLRTQRGTSYESGISYQTNENLLDLSLYQLNLRDEIAFDPLQTPQNPFGSNLNLAPTTRTGTALSLKAALAKNLRGDAQINYVHARFQSGMYAGNHIPLVSDVVLRAGLLFRLAEHWQCYTEAVYTGRQFPANDNANISGGQGGYTLFNFNLRYHYQAFSAALHVNNIFNTNYYLYTVYQTGPVNEYFYPAPDRNLMLTLTYSLP